MPLTEKQLAELAELTGEELITRGQRMLTLGHELMGMSAKLVEQPSNLPIVSADAERVAPVANRDVSAKLGAITEDVVIEKTIELGTFSTDELGEMLGVPASTAMKWIARLMSSKAIERCAIGTYRTLLKPSVEMWLAHCTHPFEYADVSEGTGLQGTAIDDELDRLEQEGRIEWDEETGRWRVVPPAEAKPKGPPIGPPSTGLTARAERTGPVRIRTERKQRRARSTPGQRQKTINNERNFARLEAAQAERAEQARKRQEAREAKERGGKRKK